MTILDTNVISEMMRPAPEATVLQWFRSQPAEDLHVTAITVAEIFFGIELLPGGKRRAALRAGAEKMFGVVFAGHVLGFEEQAARALPVIACSRRRQGRPISQFDAQIAAISAVNGASLATRDVAGFANCGVTLINPWGE
jgi:predicted nucleic acid-binding protein